MSMSWTKLLTNYGLTKPYDFSVVILVLMGIALFSLALISSIATYISTDGYTLSFESPRFLYFLYVGLLGILTSLLAPYKKLAVVIFVVGFFEFSLGFGLATINKFGFRLNSLLPSASPQVPSGVFSYHPLLVGIPKPNFSHPGNAHRIRVGHNEHGQRAVETSSDNGVNLIAVFGGSSTYDVGLSNPNTWLEILATDLGKTFQIRNNGVPGYGTTEHLIQTSFYIDRGFNTNPNCAVYYVGWNDIRNVGLPDIDSGFANYHGLSQFDTFRFATGKIFSPLSVLASRFISSIYIPRAKRYSADDVIELTDEDISDSKVFEVSFNNLDKIIALNERRGISTILIPQIMNSFRLISQTSYGWMPRLADKDVMRVLDHFNEKLETLASDTSAIFLPVAQSNFVESDFVDMGHFSENGARKFVSLLVEGVRTACSFRK